MRPAGFVSISLPATIIASSAYMSSSGDSTRSARAGIATKSDAAPTSAAKTGAKTARESARDVRGRMSVT